MSEQIKKYFPEKEWCGVNSDDWHEIDDLAEDALNTAIAVIHERLGVTTGDLAAHCFSNDKVKEEFCQFIEQLLEEPWKGRL